MRASLNWIGQRRNIPTKSVSEMHHPVASYEWRYLAYLNYRVEPDRLQQLLPKGLQADCFDGSGWVSLVCLVLRNPKIGGVRLPFFRDFEVVQLRAAVRRGGLRDSHQGVAFLSQTVPSSLLAMALRSVYREHVGVAETRRRLGIRASSIDVDYRWKAAGRWNTLAGRASGRTEWAEPGSLEEFLTCRTFAYVRRTPETAVELRVQYPRWVIRRFESVSLELSDPVFLDEPRLKEALSGPPHSAFLAEGSPVELYGALSRAA